MNRHPSPSNYATQLAAARKQFNLKDFQGAIATCTRLIQSGGESADVANLVGECLMSLGDFVSAGRAFKRAIELDRSHFQSFYNLGLALGAAGNSYETFATFKRCCEVAPRNFESYAQVFGQIQKLRNWHEGLPTMEAGLKNFPESALLAKMVATVYGKVGRHRMSEDLFKKAVKLDPTQAPAYAHWLQEEGRFEESLPLILSAIEANPTQGQAYYNLSVARRFDVAGKPLQDVVGPMLDQRQLTGEEEMFAYYALAKTEESQKNYERAMGAYDKANGLAYGLYNSKSKFTQAEFDEEFRELSTLFTKSSVAALRAFGSQTTTPVFIVGMIRTGTTLLDQMLACHPNVESVGEQPFWMLSAGRANSKLIRREDASSVIRGLSEGYQRLVQSLAPTSDRVVDKMPTNFFHMGLMAAAFPKAKFIHARRSPLDTCLSIYTTFLGSGTQFAYNKSNIVLYYKAYLRLMDHWRNVLHEEQLLEIDYEDLVSNPERVMRRVLSFVEIDWDPACLHPENRRSQVSTPSLYTARQPVSTSSVERWRSYEPWLGELLELQELGPRASSRSI